MNSFNHYAYGAIGEWLYATVAGIDIDPECPGYRHLVLRPRPGGGLTSARAALDTLYGRAVSDWHIDRDRFVWTIVVPPNTTATAYVPAIKGTIVQESGRPAEEIRRCHLCPARRGDGCVPISVRQLYIRGGKGRLIALRLASFRSRAQHCYVSVTYYSHLRNFICRFTCYSVLYYQL